MESVSRSKGGKYAFAFLLHKTMRPRAVYSHGTHLEGAAGPGEAVAKELAHAAAGGIGRTAGCGVADLRLGGWRARGCWGARRAWAWVGVLLDGVGCLHTHPGSDTAPDWDMRTTREMRTIGLY